MQNKVEKKKFLGMEVRVVNGTHMVLKDMFSALGRVRNDGTWTDERKKVGDFANMGIVTAPETFVVTSNGKKQSRESQEMPCILLTDTPLILTQFKPTARAGEEALNTWVEFMKFVNGVLTSLEVYKYIVSDKKQQLKHQDILTDLGGKAMIMNTMVCEIMAKLIGVDGKVKKDEIRVYQDQTTIDLTDVHEFVIQQFENAYRFTKSHAKAKEMAYQAALEQYPFEINKSA